MTTRLMASVGYRRVVQPLVRVRRSTALDVDERLPESHADLASAAVAHDPGSARRLDRADWRDHGRRPAGKDFRKRAVLATLPPFIDADPAFLRRVTEIAADRQQGLAGNPWEQGAGQGRRHEPGLVSPSVHEAQVHAAHLLDPAVLAGVEPHDLGAALRGRP